MLYRVSGLGRGSDEPFCAGNGEGATEKDQESRQLQQFPG